MLQALQPCFAQLKVVQLAAVQASVTADLVSQMPGLEHLHLYHMSLTSDAAAALSKVSSLRGLIIGASAAAKVGGAGW
jgi:hypothetical protein